MSELNKLNDELANFFEKFAKDNDLDAHTAASYMLSYSISLLFVLIKDREQISNYLEQLVDSYDKPSKTNKTLH